MFDIEQFANSGELFDGRYKLLQTLSTDGGSADVWLALDVNTIDQSLDDISGVDESCGGLKVAIKIYRPKNALDIEGEQKFREEYKIVYNCHHANLLQPTNFSIFRETPYLVLPYCQKGSSELYIGSGLSDDMLWKYIKDVSSGLSYLHHCQPPIIHQDVKPANVMINDDGNFAITDFGISEQFDGKHSYNNDDSGTFAYMAPERFWDNPVPQKACDIWGLGATLYELIVGHVPFGEDGGQNQPDGPVVLDFFDHKISGDVKRLIKACLSYDPDERPTADELVDAANKRQFKRFKLPKFLKLPILLCSLVILFLGVYSLVRKVDRSANIVLSQEQVFDNTCFLLSSNDTLTFLDGLSAMDSLASTGYIPALYQMFYTYGWYSDIASLKRKDMLDIKYREQDFPQWLPYDEKVNEKAIGYLKRIISNTDPIYDSQKAQAYLRLAAYYSLPNGADSMVSNKAAFIKRLNIAKSYLSKSKEFADKNNDTILLQKIRVSCKSVDEQLKEVK